MPRRLTFEQFVEASRSIRTKSELYALIIDVAGAYGYDRVNFSIGRDLVLDRRHWGFGLINSYCPVWQTYYGERGYALIDPVYRRANGMAPPFRWRDIELQEDLTPAQIDFMREGEEAGLYNGVGIPLRGPRMQIAGIALASSIRHIGSPIGLEVLSAICDHFYTIYRRVCGATESGHRGGRLSEREREVLVGAAQGRTDDDIGQVLGMSSNTVNSHFRHIFEKLSVSNRGAAIGLSMKHGLIDF